MILSKLYSNYGEDKLKAYDRIFEALRALDRCPSVGLVLGSGLGAFADTFEDAEKHSFRGIPHFPEPSVEGHSGQVCFGRVAGVNVVALQGRVHFYEGHDMDTVVFPVRVMVAMGIKTLIVTNAAGGVDRDYRPGNLVLIRDHVNLMGVNPLRGPNDDRLGTRFPDMTDVYSRRLRLLAQDAARTLGMELREGVYAAFSGPTYETPAEVEMARKAGADLVGMSTVPEVIAARHMARQVAQRLGQDPLEILGISCVTNMAAGITGQELSHEEVADTATKSRDAFIALLVAFIGRLAARPA